MNIFHALVIVVPVHLSVLLMR